MVSLFFLQPVPYAALFSIMPATPGILLLPVIYLSGTTLIMTLIVAVFIPFFKQQQRSIQLSTEDKNKLQMQFLNAALEAQEAERKRIFNELHDGVGALLSAMKLYLHQLQTDDLSKHTKVSLLNESKNILDETVKTIRNISLNLQPVIIEDFGLESAVKQFCNKIDNPPTLSVSFAANQALAKLSHEKELAVFRIIQELANNIIRHANSSVINFYLAQEFDVIEIFIEYNGKGMSQQEYEKKLYQSHGLGLKNIHSRLNILKGYVHYKKNNNLTNTITLKIPIADQKH